MNIRGREGRDVGGQVNKTAVVEIRQDNRLID